MLHEEDGRLFRLAELGEPLRSDAPDSVAAIAAFVGQPYMRAAWSALAESVRTGENGFRLVHGVGAWEYRRQRPDDGAIVRPVHRSKHPARDAGAARRLRLRSLRDDRRRRGRQRDVAAALRAEYPSLRGIVFDQPQVVEGLDLGDGIEFVGGSFFESVPEGGDAYVLKWILHDWEDDEAVAILRTIRRSGGIVLVIERLLGPPNDGLEAKLTDLHMLVGPGGRERTLDEYRALFAAAGYRLVGVQPERRRAPRPRGRARRSTRGSKLSGSLSAAVDPWEPGGHSVEIGAGCAAS